MGLTLENQSRLFFYERVNIMRIGITIENLIHILKSQGYKEVKGNPMLLQNSMTDDDKTVIMRFEISPISHSNTYADVKVLVRIKGAEGGFELMGVGNVANMRIAPGGKLLGIKSVPKKQRFDRKKHRAAIADGRVYTRGDK